MRLTLLATSPLVLLVLWMGLSLACAGPSGGGDDTGGSDGSSSDLCYEAGYQDCADGYAPAPTCNSSDYCDGYCNCDGYGDYCNQCG